MVGTRLKAKRQPRMHAKYANQLDSFIRVHSRLSIVRLRKEFFTGVREFAVASCYPLSFCVNNSFTSSGLA